MDASPATEGVGIGLALAPAAPPSAQSPSYSFDLSTCTPANNCVANADGSRAYTLTTGQIPVGTYNLLIATWDVPPTANTFPAGTTHELSDTETSQQITAINTTINATLDGIPASVSMTPVSGQTHVVFDGTSGYDVIGNVATQWNAVALDNDGYLIAGSGAPIFNMSDGTGSFAFTTSAQPSGQILTTITALKAQPSPVSVSVTATGIGPSGVVSAPSTLALTPVQELWTTATSDAALNGIYGYPLYPSSNGGNYFPYAQNCCVNTVSVDQLLNAAFDYQAIAQDSGGKFWVYDSTNHQVVQYAASGAGLSATGVVIPSIPILYGLVADGNGYLYGVDGNTTLYVWQVVGLPTPSQATVTVPGANAEAVAVVPNASTIPSALRGAVVVGNSNGVNFYSNASAGMPTLIGAAATEFGTPFAVAIGPDDGTLWTVESSEGNEIVAYTIASATSIVSTAQTGFSYGAAAAAGIADNLYLASDSAYYPVVQFYLSGGSAHENFTYIGNGTGPNYIGSYVAP